MEYTIAFHPSQRVFALPCEAADSYIKDAGAAELRVLLYVYRHGGPVDSVLMARELGLADGEAAEGLEFWAKRGLFSCEAVSEAAEPTAQPMAQPIGAPAPETKSSASADPRPNGHRPSGHGPDGHRRPAAGRVVESPVAYSAGEVSQKIEQDEGIRFVLETVPSLLGRLLSPAECSALINLYEDAGLPADVILMAVEYCVTNGRTNFRYIEKLALGWAGDGVNTHELAESRIRQLEARHSFEGRVRTVAGITDRALSAKERGIIGRWAEWDPAEELIRLAYEICVARTGKLSLSYMNSILSSWHDKGIRTEKQAREEAGHGKSAPAEKRGVSFDVGEYVDLSMKRLLKD